MATPPTPGQPGKMLPGEFESASVANLIKFGMTGLQPPSIVYIQRDDVLVLQVTSAIANELVTLSARLLLPDGTINVIDFAVTAVTPNATKTQSITLAEGFLLSVGVAATNANSRGLTYTKVFLARGGATAANAVDCLFADYTTNAQMSGWPIGRILGTTESSGCIRSISVANPAAGVDFTLQPPNGTRWRIISLSAVFTASAQVANRLVHLTIADTFPAVTTYESDDIPAIVATGTNRISAYPGAFQSSALSANISLALPFGTTLSSSFATQSIQSVTTGIQTGDQWSAIAATVEAWLDF